MHFYPYIFAVIFAVFLIHTVSSEQDKTIASARIESCPGCSLNRLPQVKAFIYEDIPKYDNVEFKKIHGAIPELVLLNAADEEIERLQLSRLNRKECNDLLVSKGFSHKIEDNTNAEL